MLSECPPPKGDGKRVPFLRRVKKQERFQCQILSAQVRGRMTHWVPKMKRTIVCKAIRDGDGNVTDVNDCTGCRGNCDERWYGYIYVWASVQSRFEFVEITGQTMSNITARIGGSPNLRGWELTLARGNGAKTQVSVTIEPPRPHIDMAKLPPEVMPDDTLMHTMRED